MAYRIVYEEDPVKLTQCRTRPLRLQTMTAAFFLLFTLLVKVSWNEGTEKLREYLIPGALSVTQAAFQSFMEDLQEGEPVADALTTFCQDIISHG